MMCKRAQQYAIVDSNYGACSAYSGPGTLKSLFWSFTLMALVIYIFGILFTDVLLDFRETAGSTSPDLEQMKKYFGNLGSSSATLFRAISDGISWEIAADSLQPAGHFWVQLFHFYVAFCT